MLLLNPRPGPHMKQADCFMPTLKSHFSFPLAAAHDAKDMVIISDSSLDLPSVIYGLQCKARSCNLRLLWIGVVPGAGARELVEAWMKAPMCDFGLTVVNMNDVMKHTPWHISEEDKTDLNLLVRTAKSRCSKCADVFINHARFYSRLPPEYAVLVPVYMTAARDAGATVHDGEAYLREISLRDHMHFAEESTRAVVDMYFDAIRQMLSTSRDGDPEALPPHDVLLDTYDYVSMAAEDGDADYRASVNSEDEVTLSRDVDLSEQERAIGTFIRIFWDYNSQLDEKSMNRNRY